MADRVELSKDWRKVLTPEQYKVLREGSTEAPFTGSLLHNKAEGTYRCAACGSVIFDSTAKFDSGSGWPSFYDAKPGAVTLNEDVSHGMTRVEVTCAQCGGHLGHVFNDAPEQPTGKRFCINSASLQFLPKDGEQ
jgi:peptide-methionine (R)-S-oxide reductase